MVMADMQIRPGEAWKYCPRYALRKVTKVLLDEFNVVRINPSFFLQNFVKTIYCLVSSLGAFIFVFMLCCLFPVDNEGRFRE
jgi:hypothetical protein